MKISWKLINKEIGKECKTLGVQSLLTNGRSITDDQIIANTFNNHFAIIPIKISCKRKVSSINFVTNFDRDNCKVIIKCISNNLIICDTPTISK
jgi:high-affinity K+ transport system ATPase subunit B